MLPKKHLSGAAKRKWKRQEEQFVQSQQGALDKFFSASSSVVRDDNPIDAPNNQEEEQQQVNDNLSEQVDAIENEIYSIPLNLKIQLMMCNLLFMMSLIAELGRILIIRVEIF